MKVQNITDIEGFRDHLFKWGDSGNGNRRT